MVLRPCPICRKPTSWEGNAWKPFCSERCQTRDLGAWASEDYALEAQPDLEMDEGWSGEGPEG